MIANFSILLELKLTKKLKKLAQVIMWQTAKGTADLPAIVTRPRPPNASVRVAVTQLGKAVAITQYGNGTQIKYMPKPLFDYEQLIATVGGGFDPPPKPKDSDGDGTPDNYDSHPYDDKKWVGTQ